MRRSPQILRAAIYSWIAALLVISPAARGEDAAPPAAAPTTQPLTMRFKRYAITDDQGFQGMEVFHGIMPIDWTVKGGVTWKMALAEPELIRIHWGDAQDMSAFDVYPVINFCSSDIVGRGGRNLPGQIFAGNIIKETPTDQFDAIEKVIVGMLRPDLANARVVKKEPLPDAAQAIHDQVNTDPTWPISIAVGRETFEYELNGQTMQEIICGVFSVGGGPSANNYRIWSVTQATSERAPKATFDQLNPINAIMIKSLQINPQWNQKVADLISQRRQQALANQRQAAANQQAQFNAIESRISAQTAANDAQHASYWQHSADLQRQSDARADVMREVSPWKDSNGDTYKLPNNYGHAWAGADGTIIMNNDPGYNPNSDSSLSPTNWTPMEQQGN